MNRQNKTLLVFILMLAFAMALLVSCPADALAPPEPEFRLTAATWCVVKVDSSEPDTPGCDIGVGVALHRAKRLAIVAAIGTETLGSGIAWVAQRGGEGKPTIAISLGIVARYDEDGIDGSKIYPALGATFGFGK